MGTAWDVHRCAGPSRCVPLFSRVSCVYTSLDLKDVRMLSATRGPVKLLWRTKATEPPSASSFLPLFEIFLSISRKLFRKSLQIVHSPPPFVSRKFLSRARTKISKFSPSSIERFENYRSTIRSRSRKKDFSYLYYFFPNILFLFLSITRHVRV